MYLGQVLEKILYPNQQGCHKILSEDWDFLIILDAFRYDVFSNLVRECNWNGYLLKKISCGPPTSRFIKFNFLDFPESKNKTKDIIYINANPIVDQTLKGSKKDFLRFVPVWKYEWNKKLNTVHPLSVIKYTLKFALKYPKRRFIVHFLQPHYPFIGPKYGYVSNILHKEMVMFIRNALKEFDNTNFGQSLINKMRYFLNFHLKTLLKGGYITDTSLYLNLFSESDRRALILKAYLENCKLILNYVSLLIYPLKGKIVITSDHGEAFGEPLHKYVPLKVYGHPNGVLIESLKTVPWYIIYKEEYGFNTSAKRIIKMLKLVSEFTT